MLHGVDDPRDDDAPLPTVRDDDLAIFAAGGPWPLPPADEEGVVETEDAEYIAAGLPRAALVRLGGVSHFAPVQRPAVFDAVVEAFLARSW